MKHIGRVLLRFCFAHLILQPSVSGPISHAGLLARIVRITAESMISHRLLNDGWDAVAAVMLLGIAVRFTKLCFMGRLKTIGFKQVLMDSLSVAHISPYMLFRLVGVQLGIRCGAWYEGTEKSYALLEMYLTKLREITGSEDHAYLLAQLFTCIPISEMEVSIKRGVPINDGVAVMRMADFMHSKHYQNTMSKSYRDLID